VVAAGEPASERQEAFEELVARGEIVETGVAAEQALHARGAGLGGCGQRGAARWRRKCV
jgi:hypothetical protein